MQVTGVQIKDKTHISRNEHDYTSVSLKRNKMAYTEISDVDKQRIFDAYENLDNYEETTRVLGIKRNSRYAAEMELRIYRSHEEHTTPSLAAFTS